MVSLRPMRWLPAGKAVATSRSLLSIWKDSRKNGAGWGLGWFGKAGRSPLSVRAQTRGPPRGQLHNLPYRLACSGRMALYRCRFILGRQLAVSESLSSKLYYCFIHRNAGHPLPLFRTGLLTPQTINGPVFARLLSPAPILYTLVLLTQCLRLVE